MTGIQRIPGGFTCPKAYSRKAEAAAEKLGLPIIETVQRQLGLRLKPARGQVEALVIDHVERPSENRASSCARQSLYCWRWPSEPIQGNSCVATQS